MQRFELTFVLRFSEEFRGDKKTTEFGRVIVVPNLKWAVKVAEAMLGEEIYTNESLAQVISVAPTESLLNIAAWDDGTLTWQRALRRMSLNEDQVQFVLAERNPPGPVKQKVGFVFLSQS